MTGYVCSTRYMQLNVITRHITLSKQVHMHDEEQHLLVLNSLAVQ